MAQHLNDFKFGDLGYCTYKSDDKNFGFIAYDQDDEVLECFSGFADEYKAVEAAEALLLKKYT